MINCPYDGKTCQLPKKVHITDIVNGVAHSLSVCAQCPFINNLPPKEQIAPVGLLAAALPAALLQKLGFSLQQLNQNLIQQQQLAQQKCQTCGISLLEIFQNGRIGCAGCYNTFSQQLRLIIGNCQDGKSQHTGKTPLHSHKQQQIADLQKEMDEAVKKEEYEKAAKLRDQIKELGDIK